MPTLTRDEIKNKALHFVEEHADDCNEIKQAQVWIYELFRNVFGINPYQVNAGFEFRIDNKRIDHLFNGLLLTEMKSRGQKLDLAKAQAYRYVMKLSEEDIPQYVLLSNFENIELHNLETRTVIKFRIEDLPQYVDQFDFLREKEVKVRTPQTPVNVQAAKKLEQLHSMLRETNYPKEHRATLITRIVFCLFADDTDIFEKNQFHSYILNETREDGSDLISKICDLFSVLNTPEDKRWHNKLLQGFRFVNGGLFKVDLPSVELPQEARELLLEITELDWKMVSPIIFGSMFEGALDDQERHDLGAHFTSEENIMKVINSLFLDDPKEELDHILNLKVGRLQKLHIFHDRLADLKFLDPACGSGNFLLLAYRELRRIEHEVIHQILMEEYYQENPKNRKKDYRIGLDIRYQDNLLPVQDMIKVEVAQFYGIEIIPYAASISKLGLWLMDHLMNLEASGKFGQVIVRLPLHEGANIRVCDALETDWNDIVDITVLNYILGNPPFNGNSKMSNEQRNILKKVVPFSKKMGHMDYVAGWFFKAAEAMEQNTNIKAGMVATNSIVQGEQAINVWGYLLKKDYNIIFGHQTFNWDNNGAMVHVVIIGFSKDADKNKVKKLFQYSKLNSQPKLLNCTKINEYLLPMESVFITPKKKQISGGPSMSFGSKPNDGGNYFLSEKDMKTLVVEVPEIKKYIYDFWGARELLNNKSRKIMYLKNVPVNLINRSSLIKTRLDLIREYRSNDKASKDTKKKAEYPTMFVQDEYRDSDLLIIPRVSSGKRKYLPVGFVKKPAIASSGTFQLVDADLYICGLLLTRMHSIWLEVVGGMLKSDYRYSNELVYNTFVFPIVTRKQKKHIEKLCQKILETRKKYLDKKSNLAELYNDLFMPADLRKAHQDLDRAVEQLYRKEPFKSDEERVEHLIKLYQEAVAKER